MYPDYFSDISNEPELKDIREKTILVFNRNFWIKGGVYVIPDPEAKGLSEKFDENELEKKLKNKLFWWRSRKKKKVRFRNDRSLRFAPRESFSVFEQRYEDEPAYEKIYFRSDSGFLIANFGIEGTKKLMQVSKEFRFGPELHGIELNDLEGKDTVSTISYISELYNNLYVNGTKTDEIEGYALGVIK